MPDSSPPDTASSVASGAGTTATSTTVAVRVVYLARLRDAFGTAMEVVRVPGPAPTVAALLACLRARGGVWADELKSGRAYRVAVNHDLAAPGAPLRDGDEVAVLPPVTGG